MINLNDVLTAIIIMFFSDVIFLFYLTCIKSLWLNLNYLIIILTINCFYVIKCRLDIYRQCHKVYLQCIILNSLIYLSKINNWTLINLSYFSTVQIILKLYYIVINKLGNWTLQEYLSIIHVRENVKFVDIIKKLINITLFVYLTNIHTSC